MPLYVSSFVYTPEVWAGLIRSPENREETVRRILEEAGCKLRGLWYAFGEGDSFALIEAPTTRPGPGSRSRSPRAARSASSRRHR